MTSISDTEVVNAPGGLVELDFNTISRTNVAVSGTGTANATELVSTTVVCDGSPIIIEFQCGISITNGEYLSFGIWIDNVYTTTLEGSLAVAGRCPISAWARLTPTAGTKTISVRWWRWSGSTFTSYIEGNCRVRVSKILQASQLLVTQSNAPIVTSLPAGNLVTGQEVYLYTAFGYVRYIWDGSSWGITADNRKISFIAHGNTSANYQGSTNGFYNFLFTSTTINDGNGYSTSNGRFTAPVTGLYHFSLNARLDGTPSGGYLRSYIWRPDGGLDAWAAPNLHAIFGNNHATDYQTMNVSGLMYLTAGQYVNAGGGHISGASNLLRNESTFTGHLVK
jgi:hypothetical protein